MPHPGDPCPGLIVDVGRCWQMVYDRKLRADDCPETPTGTGRWVSRPHGGRWCGNRGVLITSRG